MGHVLSLTSKHKIFLVLASLLIIILLICLLYNKLKAQRMEDNKRRLALQVLTHEFRTPVTSLVLLAEEAQKKFEKYDEESQELLLRLSSEIHRLFRLVDASRNYLNFDQGKKLVNFKPKQIKSVNEFINSVLSPYIEQVNFIGLEKDCSFYSDEYWVSICLKNLVENAINHGAKPILVKLESTDNMLKVIVEDQGVCDFDNLEELTGEFIKGSKSQGTGLGLNIVKKVLHDMKADLFFKQSPTTFTMVLREIK